MKVIKVTEKPAQPLTPRRNWKKIILIAIAIIFIGLVVGVVYFVAARWSGYVQKSNSDGDENQANCTDILNPNCWDEAFRPKLDSVDGKTNVLIIGSDVRGEVVDDKKIGNTDTIIFGSYNYQTNQAKMVSFPRDLYAPYQYKDGGATYKTKINAIYAAGNLYGENHDGSKVLQRTIEKVTGEKIQYVIVIRLEGVIKAIDAIGGIDINVPVDHTDAYPKAELPPDLQKTCKVPHPVRPQDGFLRAYCLFSFKKGEQHMDGQTALIYARMRELSTDFDRARRQQEVINAIKDKIVNDQSSLPQKAQNLYNLYTSLGPYITLKFNLNIETILAGLDIAQRYQDQGQPAKVILDPTFAGGGVIIKGEGTNFNFADYSFKQVQSKLKIVDAYLDYYNDKPNIYVVNATGQDLPKDHPLQKMKNDHPWFVTITILKKTIKDKSGVEIVDFTNGEKWQSLKKLQKDLSSYGDVKVQIADEQNGLKKNKNEDIAVYLYPNSAPEDQQTSQ